MQVYCIRLNQHFNGNDVIKYDDKTLSFVNFHWSLDTSCAIVCMLQSEMNTVCVCVCVCVRMHIYVSCTYLVADPNSLAPQVGEQEESSVEMRCAADSNMKRVGVRTRSHSSTLPTCLHAFWHQFAGSCINSPSAAQISVSPEWQMQILFNETASLASSFSFPLWLPASLNEDILTPLQMTELMWMYKG